MTAIEGAARGIPDPAAGRRRWLALGVIGIAQLMVVLDLPVINIALQGSDTAFWWTCAIAVAGAVLTALLLRPGPLVARRSGDGDLRESPGAQR